jgi:hypothetical protein
VQKYIIGGVWSAPGNAPVFPEGLGCADLACVATNADAEASEPATVWAHERGGVGLAANAAADPVKDTASIELIGATEGVITAEAEALEARAESETGRGLNTALRGGSTERM